MGLPMYRTPKPEQPNSTLKPNPDPTATQRSSIRRTPSVRRSTTLTAAEQDRRDVQRRARILHGMLANQVRSQNTSLRNAQPSLRREQRTDSPSRRWRPIAGSERMGDDGTGDVQIEPVPQVTFTRTDGLGDRRRSLSEEAPWETLPATIPMDERLPSASSSFTTSMTDNPAHNLIRGIRLPAEHPEIPRHIASTGVRSLVERAAQLRERTAQLIRPRPTLSNDNPSELARGSTLPDPDLDDHSMFTLICESDDSDDSEDSDSGPSPPFDTGRFIREQHRIGRHLSANLFLHRGPGGRAIDESGFSDEFSDLPPWDFQYLSHTEAFLRRMRVHHGSETAGNRVAPPQSYGTDREEHLDRLIDVLCSGLPVPESLWGQAGVRRHPVIPVLNSSGPPSQGRRYY